MLCNDAIAAFSVLCSQGEGKNNERHVQHRGGSARTSKLERTPEDGVLALIHHREISGNRRSGYSSSSAQCFQGDYLEMNATQPRVFHPFFTA